jgi:hypothetical protein
LNLQILYPLSLQLPSSHPLPCDLVIMLINLLYDLPTEASLRWSSLQASGQQMSAHHMTFSPVGCALVLDTAVEVDGTKFVVSLLGDDSP